MGIELISYIEVRHKFGGYALRPCTTVGPQAKFVERATGERRGVHWTARGPRNFFCVGAAPNNVVLPCFCVFFFGCLGKLTGRGGPLGFQWVLLKPRGDVDVGQRLVWAFVFFYFVYICEDVATIFLTSKKFQICIEASIICKNNRSFKLCYFILAIFSQSFFLPKYCLF